MVFCISFWALLNNQILGNMYAKQTGDSEVADFHFPMLILDRY